MIKRITSIILLAMSSFALYAGQDEAKEQIKTNRWSVIIGASNYSNNFFNDHEYTGSAFGLEYETGSFYKKNEKVSWDMKFTLLSSPEYFGTNIYALYNPAGTTYVYTTELSAEYGSYYHWEPIKGLNIKAGSTADFLFGLDRSQPNSINNIISPQVQLLFKAAAGAKYTWEFKKFNLGIFGNISIPLFGLITNDSEFQSTMDIISGSSGLLKGNINHIIFAAPHNFQGYNMEIGMELVYDRFNFFISTENYDRWWNSFNNYNYRKMGLFKIGFSMNIVKLSYRKSNNRYF